MAMKMKFFNSSENKLTSPPKRIYPTLRCKMDTSTDQGKQLAPRIEFFLINYNDQIWNFVAESEIQPLGLNLQRLKEDILFLNYRVTDIPQEMNDTLRKIALEIDAHLNHIQQGSGPANLSTRELEIMLANIFTQKLQTDISFTMKHYDEKPDLNEVLIIPTQETPQPTPSLTS